MKKLNLSLLAAAAISAFSASASQVVFTEVPENWQLENSMGDTINAYYTSTACPSGRLRLGANATADDRKRFWGTVMTAKVTGREMIVAYDNELEDCQLLWFRLK